MNRWRLGVLLVLLILTCTVGLGNLMAKTTAMAHTSGPVPPTPWVAHTSGPVPPTPWVR